MKDKIKTELSKRQPQHAEGKICIDLTDPLTGKVKDRIEGKNHIFADTMFSQGTINYLNQFNPWTKTVSTAQLLLTDSSFDIDDEIPYVFGAVLGTGTPSANGSGTLQGAYNATNQRLAVYDGDSVYWKFQYDFTPPQARGTIRTIGLSYQYLNAQYILPPNIPTINANYSYPQNTADGRYVYIITPSGVITKFDVLAGTSTTIDKSAVVGNDSSVSKKVGYDPSTGYYYVFAYHYNTAASRKLYRFSDNTFTTLLATYSISNTSYSQYVYEHPVYLYGDYLFVFYASYIYTCNYVNNTAFTSSTPSRTSLVSGYQYELQYYSLPFCGRYLRVGGAGYSNSDIEIIYDLQTQSAVAWGFISQKDNSYPFTAMALYPGTSIPCFPGVNSAAYGYSNVPTMLTRTAIAAKKLATPVVKTTANGMTVTYELEVTY